MLLDDASQNLFMNASTNYRTISFQESFKWSDYNHLNFMGIIFFDTFFCHLITYCHILHRYMSIYFQIKVLYTSVSRVTL